MPEQDTTTRIEVTGVEDTEEVVNTDHHMVGMDFMGHQDHVLLWSLLDNTNSAIKYELDNI
jgi:hypothetical protein